MVGPAGLGVRRLSIIDLAGGHQPISNEDGTVWLVFNGEIYNYQRLRDGLLQRGHRFATHTDTEVIVHLYEEKGVAGVADLDGMFAFALWDNTRRRLILARDRAGEKPLFYRLLPDSLVFGSELKCLHNYRPELLSIDPVAVQKYLVYGYVPAPSSIYRDVLKLRPAETLELCWDSWRPHLTCYWRASQHQKQAYAGIDQAADALEERLTESIRAQLRSDVPLGVFLSGGIDSSIVTALMRTSLPAEGIHAFSIGFEDSAYSELPYAQAVARHLGVQHHVKQFPMRECRDLLIDLQFYCDEPIADPSILPTYLLSRFAREQVTVALSGDGSDELFGGYPKHGVQMRLEPFDRLPWALRAPAIRTAAMVGGVMARRHGDSKAARALQMLDVPPYVRNQTWIGPAPYSSLAGLMLDGDAPAREYDLYAETLHESVACQGLSRLDHVLYLDQRMALQNLFLVKVDRASMATSLEVRAPYLSRGVMEFASALPDDLRVRGKQTKVLLRHLAHRHLPAEIIERPKQGFGIPVGHLMRTTFRDHVVRISDRLEAISLSPSPMLRNQIVDHVEGRHDYSALLWSLLVLTLWAERWSR